MKETNKERRYRKRKERQNKFFADKCRRLLEASSNHEFIMTKRIRDDIEQFIQREASIKDGDMEVYCRRLELLRQDYTEIYVAVEKEMLPDNPHLK